jgi:hypothetical protein
MPLLTRAAVQPSESSVESSTVRVPVIAIYETTVE